MTLKIIPGLQQTTIVSAATPVLDPLPWPVSSNDRQKKGHPCITTKRIHPHPATCTQHPSHSLGVHESVNFGAVQNNVNLKLVQHAVTAPPPPSRVTIHNIPVRIDRKKSQLRGGTSTTQHSEMIYMHQGALNAQNTGLLSNGNSYITKDSRERQRTLRSPFTRSSRSRLQGSCIGKTHVKAIKKQESTYEARRGFMVNSLHIFTDTRDRVTETEHKSSDRDREGEREYIKNTASRPGGDRGPRHEDQHTRDDLDGGKGGVIPYPSLPVATSSS